MPISISRLFFFMFIPISRHNQLLVLHHLYLHASSKLRNKRLFHCYFPRLFWFSGLMCVTLHKIKKYLINAFISPSGFFVCMIYATDYIYCKLNLFLMTLAKKTMALFFCLLGSCRANSSGLSPIRKEGGMLNFTIYQFSLCNWHIKEQCILNHLVLAWGFFFYETKKKLSWNFIASLKKSCSFIIMTYIFSVL